MEALLHLVECGSQLRAVNEEQISHFYIVAYSGYLA